MKTETHLLSFKLVIVHTIDVSNGAMRFIKHAIIYIAYGGICLG